MTSSIQKMNQIVLISCVVLLMSITVYAENHEALIFDRVDLTLYHLPKELSKSEAKCGYWASACSADPSKKIDEKFINEHSITKRPLIVEDTYKEGDSISKVKQNICAKPFELSLVFDIRFLSFEFGFEVYYEADDFYKYHTSNSANYKTVAQATEVMRKNMLGVGLSLSIEIFQRIQEKFTEESGIKWYDGKKMNLVWIPMFKVEYDFPKMILTRVTYEIRRNNRWSMTTECKARNYVLGNETYQNYKEIGNIDLDKLYQNQANIFEDLKCPLEESCPTVENPPSCDANTQCLKKWSLIPLDQFHLYPTSPLSCSNITTIPIWKTAAEELLRKLDQFLYALFRHLGNPIHVIAGTIGNLKLPKNSKMPFSSQPIIYLDPKNNLMPVSDLIYKIVKYTIPNCKPKSKEETCEYSVIVFIHNDPNFDAKKGKMCKGTEDIGASEGWSAILKDSEGKSYENIYVCRNTQELLNKMFGRFKIKPKPTSGNLYLNNFPYLDSNGNIGFDDIEEKVIKKFNDLAGGNDEFEFDDLVAIAQTNLNDVEGEPTFIAEGEVKESSTQQL